MSSSMVHKFMWSVYSRSLGGDSAEPADDDHDDGHSEFGVHITYEDLYDSIVFLICVYVAGELASRVLRMPNLVGEIVAGILLGPPLADFVPNPEAWVLFGEMGLILLVIEAGIDIDVSTLKLIGMRGFLIAFIGSVLPIAIAIVIAFIMGSETKEAIAAGATFGPTSLGIALNILRCGGILNTPVGQLIISAAVIDDMIALVVLSQLESLQGDITVASILIPVVSALLFLIIGGYIAIFVLPGVLDRFVLTKIDKENKGKVELGLMFAILIGMMPATYYAKASFLMGAFVAGLGFCTSHELHVTFIRQFKRLLQWLMRIFFSASIGFQVPIKHFGNGKVVWQGLVFTIALVGKIIVGFLVPNFNPERRFTGLHLRDCLITGFSMAAEGEFAFVIAVFSVDSGLINEDLYASVVLAVLLSTIIPPFLLRFTISYYNKKAEEMVRKAAQEELERNHDLETTLRTEEEQREEELMKGITNQTVCFFCIQTQSQSRWGLMHKIMGRLSNMGLETIDHRSWQPRGLNTTLINEIYCRDRLAIEKGKAQQAVDGRIQAIQQELEDLFGKSDSAKVKVQRWYPGVVEELVESVHEKASTKQHKNLSIEKRLLNEASSKLEQKRTLQTLATKERSVAQILNDMPSDPTANQTAPTVDLNGQTPEGGSSQKRVRRRRQKMRSTPVVGGGLFGETKEDKPTTGEDILQQQRRPNLPSLANYTMPGHRAQISVLGDTFNIRITEETLRDLQKGYNGEMLDRDAISITGTSDTPVVDRLRGYVRNFQPPMNSIAEEDDVSSVTPSQMSKDDNGMPPV